MAQEESTEIQRVTMSLTTRDVQNTLKIKNATHARSNAQAVSSALSLASSVTDIIKDGGELLIRDKDGVIQKVLIPGLTP